MEKALHVTVLAVHGKAFSTERSERA